MKRMKQKMEGIFNSKQVESKGTVVRVELLDAKSGNPRIGKRLLVENQFDHPFSRRVEVDSDDLGFIEYGKPSSSGVTDILANGNIRFGVCNIGDVNRFEICRARGAALELKIGSEVRDVEYVVFYNFMDAKNIEIIDYGEVGFGQGS